MYSIKVCPICDHPLRLLHNIIDFSVSRESFHLLRCEFCSLMVTDPQPDQLEKYYQSENYISHTNRPNNYIQSIYLMVRKHTLKRKLQLINSYSTRGKILDVGCGTGNFLERCQVGGWQVYGVEPSSKARAEAANRIAPVSESLDQVPESDFKVVTLWHVLEHLPHLNESIEKIKGKLMEDGFLFIAVPNVDSYDAHFYKEYWAGYDVPRHLWHFSKKSLTTLLQKHQLTVIDIRPMKFDAYYVSLLSEKYKGNSGMKQLLNAAWIGIRSNYLGKNDNNFSSLIYIARK